MKEEPKTYYYKNIFGTFAIVGLVSYLVNLYTACLWMGALVGTIFSILVASIVTRNETKKNLSCLEKEGGLPEIEIGVADGLSGFLGVFIVVIPQMKYTGVLNFFLMFVFMGVAFVALMLSVLREAERPWKERIKKDPSWRGGLY